MKRLAAVGLAAILLGAAVPAAADPGHARPKITVFRFTQPPLKAGIDETLRVVAHDPDSWISEIQVQYEDDSQNGGVVFAHTYCVQDPDFSDPGTPAKLKIPIYFEHTGNYHVEVRALSSVNCAGDETTKTSATLQKDVVVVDPHTAVGDADDTPGALDISTVEQTQEVSQSSITTEVVHRITMFESFTDDQLAGPAYLELGFDLNKDESRFERILTVDMDERDGTIRASMLNTATGQARGYAAVFRSDERTLELRFPPALLQEGAHDYGWYAFVDSGSSDACPPETPCTDRAQDSGLIRHQL
jgi:hypothetical protein